MTRGTLAIILNDAILKSLEFNGDMYLEGHGEDAIKTLQLVNGEDGFLASVILFNKEHHNYDLSECNHIVQKIDTLDILDFDKDYFENWFSDYVYIKNCSDDVKTIIENDTNKEYKIEQGEIFVLYFGRVEKKIK